MIATLSQQLTGKETPVHIARVREDWHGGKNDLSVYQGDSVEIIRIKNNPEGKWLARTMDGICELKKIII